MVVVVVVVWAEEGRRKIVLLHIWRGFDAYVGSTGRRTTVQYSAASGKGDSSSPVFGQSDVLDKTRVLDQKVDPVGIVPLHFGWKESVGEILDK